MQLFSIQSRFNSIQFTFPHILTGAIFTFDAQLLITASKHGCKWDFKDLFGSVPHISCHVFRRTEIYSTYVLCTSYMIFNGAFLFILELDRQFLCIQNSCMNIHMLSCFSLHAGLEQWHNMNYSFKSLSVHTLAVLSPSLKMAGA